MNTEEKAALERLIAKLNSLRKTLSDEERQILDSMVITDFGEEVSLHQLPPDLAADGKVPEGKIPVGKVPEGSLPVDDEVSLHQLPPDLAADGKVPDEKTKIIFDPETENYKVVGRATD